MFGVWGFFATDAADKPVVRLAGLCWSIEDFVRGWLITGRVGSGKTQCAINSITFQVFKNVADWGGICLDQKGLYWEILGGMAAHFHRQQDLVLLQTKPTGASELWRPAHTINITGNPDVPASTYAKVIVDTAASLTGGRGQNPFFPTKAQMAIQNGIEILRHIDAYVTIPNLYNLLLNPEDSAATIEKLVNAGDQRSHELLVAFREDYLSQPSNSSEASREQLVPIWSISSIQKSPRSFVRTNRRSLWTGSTMEKSSASLCRKNSNRSGFISIPS